MILALVDALFVDYGSRGYQSLSIDGIKLCAKGNNDTARLDCDPEETVIFLSVGWTI